MKKVDIEENARLEKEGIEDDFLPLLSQNISVIEVGAYSHIFEKFIEFLGIKSLILTDIDSKGDLGKKDKKGNVILEACRVENGSETSNTALNHFLSGTSWKDLKTLTKEQRIIIIGNTSACICYQQDENGYHARSFEDAFIHINRDFIDGEKDKFQGLQNRKLFDSDESDAYVLADKCIKKKHILLWIYFIIVIKILAIGIFRHTLKTVCYG